MSKKLFSKLFVLLLVVGLLFAVAPTGQAQAAEMCTTACYVSPTGNDANTGLEGNPFLTIQKAINTVSDGGTIYLAEGNYVENPITTITPNKSFSLIGANDGSGKALSTIQGTLSLENSLSTDSYLIDYINFKQVSGTDSLVIKQIDNLTVRNSVFAGAGTVTGRAIQMNTGSNGNQNILIDNCRFENLYYTGIQGSVNNLTVKDSEFENLKSGINLQSGGSDLTVTDSTFSVVAQGAANDTYGIRLASSTPVGSGESLNVSGSTFNVDKAGFVAESGTYHAAIIIRAGALGPFTVENNQINGDFVDESSLANLTTIYGANTWPVGYGVLGNKITLAATLAMDPAANAAICGLSGTTTVAVKVGPVDQLSAYDITVNFDKTKVEIISVTTDGLLVGEAIETIDLGNTTGKLNVYRALKGDGQGNWNLITDLDGGTLMTITLKHLAPGEAVLKLDSSTLLSRTDDAQPYAYQITQDTSTFTVGDPVIANETTEYCDLQSAVNAAENGDTLKVLRDFSESTQTTIDKTITLNTNGKTLTFTSNDWNYPLFYVSEPGDLTITGGGVIDAPGSIAINIVNFSATGQAKVTLGDATISGRLSVAITGEISGGTAPKPALFTINGGKTSNGILVQGKGAELVVNGGLVTSGDSTQRLPIYGDRWRGGTKITITGGKVENYYNEGIYHPQDGDLIITGGSVSGTTGIIMKSGNLDISGGSHIYANGAYAEPAVWSFGQNSTGDAILIYGGTGYAGDITVNIHITEYVDDPLNAGQLTSEKAYAIREFSDTTTDTRTSSVKISSGVIQSIFGRWGMLPTSENILFTETLRDRALADVPNDTLLLTGAWYDMDPAYYVFPPLETYAALEVPSDSNSGSGYRIRQMYPFAIVRGTGTLLFPTLKDAVDGAEADETITLRLDHTATCPDPAAEVNKAITLELNGFDYIWPCAVAAYDAPLVVQTGGLLTIKDSSTGETGSIKGWNGTAMDYPDGRGSAVKVLDGSATLESGTLIGGYVSVKVQGNLSSTPSEWNTPIPATFNMTGGEVYNTLVISGNGAVANLSGGAINTLGQFAAVSGNGLATSAGTTITVEGDVTITGTESALAIYHPQTGNLTINGGTITAGSPIQMKAGSLTITGGTIKATGAYVAVPSANYNGADTTGDAIFIFSMDAYGEGPADTMTVNISGGTITSDNGYALREYVLPTYTSRFDGATITGGQFSGGTGAVIFDTNTDAVLDLTAGWYSSDPTVFVYTPKYVYLDDSWYKIGDMVGSVSGSIKLQGRTDWTGVPITFTSTLAYPATDLLSGVGGAYSVPYLVPYGYTFTTLQPRYLNVTSDLAKTFTASNGLVLGELRLRAGNAYWMVYEEETGYTGEYDNEINTGDASLIGGQYKQAVTCGALDNCGDVNFDNQVNIFDLALVGGNMDLTSTVAYHGWTP